MVNHGFRDSIEKLMYSRSEGVDSRPRCVERVRLPKGSTRSTIFMQGRILFLRIQDAGWYHNTMCLTQPAAEHKLQKTIAVPAVSRLRLDQAA